MPGAGDRFPKSSRILPHIHAHSRLRKLSPRQRRGRAPERSFSGVGSREAPFLLELDNFPAVTGGRFPMSLSLYISPSARHAGRRGPRLGSSAGALERGAPEGTIADLARSRTSASPSAPAVTGRTAPTGRRKAAEAAAAGERRRQRFRVPAGRRRVSLHARRRLSRQSALQRRVETALMVKHCRRLPAAWRRRGPAISSCMAAGTATALWRLRLTRRLGHA
uniref:Uncharacterized protein n=1 Tax=Alexandrium monilatum TaxID=311494 RepID=A0A6T0RPZ1_9DINO